MLQTKECVQLCWGQVESKEIAAYQNRSKEAKGIGEEWSKGQSIKLLNEAIELAIVAIEVSESCLY